MLLCHKQSYSCLSYLCDVVADKLCQMKKIKINSSIVDVERWHPQSQKEHKNDNDKTEVYKKKCKVTSTSEKSLPIETSSQDSGSVNDDKWWPGDSPPSSPATEEHGSTVVDENTEELMNTEIVTAGVPIDIKDVKKYHLVKAVVSIKQSNDSREVPPTCNDQKQTVTLHGSAYRNIVSKILSRSSLGQSQRSFGHISKHEMDWSQKVFSSRNIPAVLLSIDTNKSAVVALDQKNADEAAEILNSSQLIGRICSDDFKFPDKLTRYVSSSEGQKFINSLKACSKWLKFERQPHQNEIQVTGIPSDVIRTVGEIKLRIMSSR